MLIQSTSSMTPAPVSPGLASNGGSAAVPAPAQETKADARTAVAPPPSRAQLDSELGRINAALQRANKNVELSFSRDEATNREVVKVTDKETGETLVQYPSDAVLSIARSIDEFQQGLLLKRQA